MDRTQGVLYVAAGLHLKPTDVSAQHCIGADQTSLADDHVPDEHRRLVNEGGWMDDRTNASYS